MAVSSLAHPCCLQRRMIATSCHETLRSGATLTPKDPLPCLKVLQPRTLLTFRCSVCSSHFQSDRGLSQGAPSQFEIGKSLANIENQSTQHDAELQVSSLNYYWYGPDSASSRSPPSPRSSKISSHHHHYSSTCSSVSFPCAPLLHTAHCLVG